MTIAIAALQLALKTWARLGPFEEAALLSGLVFAAILFVGAVYRDDFAWLLRISGAPLIVMATLTSVAVRLRFTETVPYWTGPIFVLLMVTLAYSYAVIVRMTLYQLSGVLSATAGALGIIIDSTVVLIHQSGWKGATSFAVGLGCFVLAVIISSGKAGWLNDIATWLRCQLTLEPDSSPA